MRTTFWVWMAVAVLTLMSGTESWAKKGGNGGGGGGSPGGDEPNPEIVYTDGSAIKVMDADGGNRTTVFRATGFSPQPSWSPDGSKILFNATNSGPGVYTVNLDGSGLLLLATLASQYATRPEWSPVVAPDGNEWILFIDDGASGTKDLFAVRPDGTGRMNLTNTEDADEGSLAWSPDGKKIALVVQQVQSGTLGKDVFVLTLGVVDGALAIVASENLSDQAGGLATKEEFVTLSWSRSGDDLAISAEDGAWYDLWIVPMAAPATAANITERTDVIERFPSWAPDDSHLVYWRSAGRKDSGVYRINPDGTGESKLANGRNPSWKR